MQNQSKYTITFVSQLQTMWALQVLSNQNEDAVCTANQIQNQTHTWSGSCRFPALFTEYQFLLRVPIGWLHFLPPCNWSSTSDSLSTVVAVLKEFSFPRYVIEIGIPFLAFAPVRILRVFVYCSEVRRVYLTRRTIASQWSFWHRFNFWRRENWEREKWGRELKANMGTVWGQSLTSPPVPLRPFSLFPSPLFSRVLVQKNHCPFSLPRTAYLPFLILSCLLSFLSSFQVFLQLLILFTGNYNFFNLLTIILCMSLLDDKCILSRIQCFLCKRCVRSSCFKAANQRKYPKAGGTSCNVSVKICKGCSHFTTLCCSITVIVAKRNVVQLLFQYNNVTSLSLSSSLDGLVRG